MTVPLYRAVNQCIYCGHIGSKKEELGKEHMIPYSLDGKFVLPRASCERCSAITRDFERICSRDMFGRYRIVGDLQTRQPTERPTQLPISVHSGYGTPRREVLLPIDEYPLMSLSMPKIGYPGILVGAESTEVFRYIPRVLNLSRETESAKRIRRSGNSMEFIPEIRITEFARLLAKIAHSFAIANFGYGVFESFLPPLILGTAFNLPDYVGGVEPLFDGWDAPMGEEGARARYLVEHRVDFQEMITGDGTIYLTALITLLQFVTPTYRVVVAKLGDQSSLIALDTRSGYVIRSSIQHR